MTEPITTRRADSGDLERIEETPADDWGRRAFDDLHEIARVAWRRGKGYEEQTR